MSTTLSTTADILVTFMSLLDEAMCLETKIVKLMHLWLVLSLS